MRCFYAPRGENLVCMVMVMMVVMIVVMAAAGAVRTVLVVVVLVIMVMTAAGAVRTMFMVMMMVVVVMTAAVRAVLMMVVMVVVVAAAGAVCTMRMMVCVLDFVQHLLHEVAAALHRLKQLRAGQFLPRGGDNARVRVQSAQHGNRLVKTRRRALCRAGKQDCTGMGNLIFKKFAEVLEIHLCFECIDYRDKGVQHNVEMRILHRGNNVGQLADARRLDQDAVGMILLDNVMQRLPKVTDERAADAAGVHLVDNDARVLEKTAVNADFTKFVFDQNNLFVLQGAVQQLLDERCLARAQKT